MAKVTINIEVQVPTVPNFLCVKGQDPPISIADVDDKQLILIADQWKENLLKRAETIRQRRNPKSK